MLNVNKIKLNSPKKYSEKVKSVFGHSAETSFLDSLEHSYNKNRNNLHNDLNQLMENITIHGNALKKNPHLEDFYIYRNSVKKILEFLSLNMVELTKYQKRTVTANGKQYYQIVHRVDEELQNIFQMIQKEQHENIVLLDKIYEIKGLLINFIIDN